MVRNSNGTIADAWADGTNFIMYLIIETTTENIIRNSSLLIFLECHFQWNIFPCTAHNH